MNLLPSNISNSKSVIFILSTLSVVILFFPLFVDTPSGINTTNGSFGDYLGLITGLAGVVITITVFLIQNTTQEYSSELLRLTFFRQKYFAFILLYIFGALIYFTYGIAFSLSSANMFFGFILSIGLVLNFISLIIMSSYHMNILNTIKEVENKIVNYVKFRAKPRKILFIGNVSLDNKSQFQIINMMVPIFDTLNKSVIYNQNDVSIQCLKSLDRITKTYLWETRDYKSIDDNILLEIGDQSAFIVDAMIKANNQKFMEKLPAFLGRIGKYALNWRYNIGGTNNNAVNYSRLLVTIFTKCYKYDRTSAPKKAIESIAGFIETCVIKEYYQSATTYYYDIKEIITLCLGTPNYWSSSLIGYAINQQKKVITTAVNASRQGKNIELHFYQSIFDDIYETILNANGKFSRSDYQLIIRSAFNLESILVKVSKIHPQLPMHTKIPESMVKPTLTKYTEICRKLLLNKDIEIDFMFLNFFPEFIFVTHYIQEGPSIYSSEHQSLLNAILYRIESEISKENVQNVDEYLFSCVEDYFALLIYHGDRTLLTLQIDILTEFYNKTKKSKKIETNEKRDVYYLLKIIGAFMSNEEDLKELQNKIINCILSDFKESDFGDRRLIPSFFEQYDYHTFKHAYDEWHITPLSIWTQDFQAKVNDFVNREKGIKFISFHKQIKEICQKK